MDQQTIWKSYLEDYDEEVAFFKDITLETKQHAKHSFPSDKDTQLQIETYERTLKNASNWSVRRTLPYIEGLEDRMREALHWLKHPPIKLREGLVDLCQGEIPSNLPLVFKLWGEFQSHLAVLYAADEDYESFRREKHSGEATSKRKEYAGSFMEAVRRSKNANIEGMRYEFTEHVIDVLYRGVEPPLPNWQRDDYKKFLAKTPPLKPGETEERVATLHSTYHKGLTTKKVPSWASEILVKFFQETLFRP